MQIDDNARNSFLIVDDSTIIVERLHRLLQEVDNGNMIGHASDYHSAILRLVERRWDFVLLDINLQGKSGISVLEHIKSTISSTIVIMCTNEVDDYDRKICKRMGADFFIDKSVDFELIPSIIFSCRHKNDKDRE